MGKILHWQLGVICCIVIKLILHYFFGAEKRDNEINAEKILCVYLCALISLRQKTIAKMI